MNTLLLFFALPIATIILSIVLLKILKCPALVAATFFAIYLILTYAVLGSDFLIFAIVYTILSYITAIISKTICKIITRINRCNNCDNLQNTTTNSQAEFTVTTNQVNPVLLLGNRPSNNGRQNCCCCKRR